MTRSEFIQRVALAWISSPSEYDAEPGTLESVLTDAGLNADIVGAVVPFDSETVTMLDEIRAECGDRCAIQLRQLGSLARGRGAVMKSRLSTLAVREQAAEVRARIAELTEVSAMLVFLTDLEHTVRMRDAVDKRRDAWERELAALTHG